jgi:hypothetical protein
VNRKARGAQRRLADTRDMRAETRRKLRKLEPNRESLPQNIRNNCWVITERDDVRRKSKYIIRDYEKKYKGRENDEQEIDDQDVTRAKNGKYFTKEEEKMIRQANLHRCPTYGLCEDCFDAGPVGLLCKRCPNKTMMKWYKAVYICLENGDPDYWRFSTDYNRWIDCEFIAGLLHTDVVKEKANRKRTWLKGTQMGVQMTEKRLVNRMKALFMARVITREEMEIKRKQIKELWKNDEENKIECSQDNRSVLNDQKTI